jgi:Domain of unknown function (DUF4331)
MSHHYSGPNFAFPRGDARLDYTDLYAFPKPADPSKSILIMDVHPSFDVIQSGPTTAEPFAPEALYEIKIDMDGDAVADIAYQVRFASSEGGAQTATLRRLEGAQAAETGEGGQGIVEGAPVSMGREAQVTQAGDYRFFAGWRSDPFFFDAGAFNNFQFTGTDFFADRDICSIALELSNAVLGPKEVRLWARTVIRADGDGGGWMQAERGARPSQTPFLTGEQNEAYRAAEPADDARFVDVFAHSLEHTGGVFAGGSKAGGRDPVAGPPALCPPVPASPAPERAVRQGRGTQGRGGAAQGRLDRALSGLPPHEPARRPEPVPVPGHAAGDLT